MYIKNIDEIMKMTLLRKHETELSVNIWIYEGGSYNRDGYLKRINIQINNSDYPNMTLLNCYILSEK